MENLGRKFGQLALAGFFPDEKNWAILILIFFLSGDFQKITFGHPSIFRPGGIQMKPYSNLQDLICNKPTWDESLANWPWPDFFRMKTGQFLFLFLFSQWRFSENHIRPPKPGGILMKPYSNLQDLICNSFFFFCRRRDVLKRCFNHSF